MLPNFSYVRPNSLSEAVREVAVGGTIHAGGTDLLGCLRDGVFTSDKIVSLHALDGLRGIRQTESGLSIGALTTLSEIADHRLVQESFSALAQSAAAAASPQLRNQGTIGGNICQRPRCWYFRSDFHCLRKGGDRCYAVDGENEFHCILGGSGCYIVHPSDTAPALVALDAQIRIAGPKSKRSVPAESFFVLPAQDATRETVLQPGEIVTEIFLPPMPQVHSSYRKVRARGAWDFALAGVALAVKLNHDQVVEWVRVVLSGVAPIPWRAHAAEAKLLGKKLEGATISEAAAAATEGAAPLSHNAYKVDLVRGVVEEALLAIA
jgi:xanthine dehydrogenase YagS FAD-binding subunit